MALACGFAGPVSRMNAHAVMAGLIQAMAFIKCWPIQLRQGTAMALPMLR